MQFAVFILIVNVSAGLIWGQ